jgi:hypothetical protein
MALGGHVKEFFNVGPISGFVKGVKVKRTNEQSNMISNALRSKPKHFDTREQARAYHETLPGEVRDQTEVYEFCYL